MTRSISSPKITLKMTAQVVNTLSDGTSVSASQPSLSYTPTLANGIEVGQANRGWQVVNETIEGYEQVIYDLRDFQGVDIGAGDGNDAVGQSLDLEEIVAIVITNENVAGSVGLLEVLPSDAEGWTPIGSHTQANGGALGAKGCLMKVQPAADGFDLSDNSHRITLRAYGGPVIYSMYLFARHDDEESSSSSLSSSSSSSASSQSSSASSQSSSSSSTSSASSESSISTSSISTSSSSISTSSSFSSSSSSSVSSSSSSSQSSSSPSSESSNSSASSASSSESSSSPSSTG